MKVLPVSAGKESRGSCQIGTEGCRDWERSDAPCRDRRAGKVKLAGVREKTMKSEVLVAPCGKEKGSVLLTANEGT